MEQITHQERDIGEHRHVPGFRNRDAYDRGWNRWYCVLCDKRMTPQELRQHVARRTWQFAAILGLAFLLIYLWIK